MRDVLARIAAYKREEVIAAKSAAQLSAIEAEARLAPPVRPFGAALTRAAAQGYALIGELKKASPSRGLIRHDFDPPRLAAAYEPGGAACLSALTDGPSVMGAPGHLVAMRAATRLPVIDPYQVAEALALGADAILVILAMVRDALSQPNSSMPRPIGGWMP